LTLALLAALLLAAPQAEAPARKARTSKGARAPAGKASAAKAPAGKARGAKAGGREGGGRAGGGSLADLQPQASGPFAVRPVQVRPLDREGVVRSVLRGRAYLDAGSREGLAPGAVLELLRRGQAAATCKVEAVTERNAVCAGSGIRPGDTFAVNPRAAGSLPAELPPRPSAEELSRRLAAVQHAGFALVDFKSNRVVEAPERLRRSEVSFSHYAFISDGSGIHQERVDARVYGAETWRGSRLDLDLTAVGESQPSSTARFEPGRRAHLWVRQASLSWEAPASPWRLTAGRVLPWLVPGGATFDGAQAGWRPRSGAEVGVFGGAVPDAMTTAPGTDRATGGAYWSVEGLWGPALLRNEGRVAWVRLPDSKSRVEAETTGSAWIGGHLDVVGGVRFGSGDYASPGKLDAARVDASWFQRGWFTVYGGYHYDESRIPDVAAPALYPGRTRQATGGVSWDRMGWLVIRATGGTSRDVASQQSRSWVGPELSAPRILGRFGGASAGYAEELGTWRGRSAWLQGDLSVLPRTSLVARASWLMDERPSPLSADHNVGLSLGLTSDIRPWLRLRLSGMGRYEIPVGESTSSAWGSAAFASFEGHF
jgi:hypothetical protein